MDFPTNVLNGAYDVAVFMILKHPLIFPSPTPPVTREGSCISIGPQILLLAVRHLI